MTETKKELTDTEIKSAELTENQVAFFFDKVCMSGRESFEVLSNMVWNWMCETNDELIRTIQCQLDRPYAQDRWALCIAYMRGDRTSAPNIKIVPEEAKELTEDEIAYYLDIIRMSGKDAYKALEYMLELWIAIGDDSILRKLRDQLPEMQSKRLWADNIIRMLWERAEPLPICNCTICSGEPTGQQDLPQ